MKPSPSKLPRKSLQQPLAALESLLGVTLTVVDREGRFHGAEGRALLGEGRQSHKQQAICRSAFRSEACIGHCRHAMNARGEAEGKPFLHTCWLGVSEVVVPLLKEGRHQGNLFAGAWQAPGFKRDLATGRLSAETLSLYRSLPILEAPKALAIGQALTLAAAGLLEALAEVVPLDAPAESLKSRVRRYLEHGDGKPASLSGLASCLGLSASRTSHRVKELFGSSFRELLARERMKKAKYLLGSSDLPLAQIAAAIGMDDVFHFNKAFRSWTGTPPGRWRNRHWRPEY